MKKVVCIALALLTVCLSACTGPREAFDTTTFTNSTTTSAVQTTVTTSTTEKTSMTVLQQSTTCVPSTTTTTKTTTTVKSTTTTTLKALGSALKWNYKMQDRINNVIQNKPGSASYCYSFEGKTAGIWIDWMTSGNLAYILSEYSNEYSLTVFNADRASMEKQISLVDKPSRMKVINDNLWISFKEARKIVVYNLNTLKEIREIVVPGYRAELNSAFEAFDVYKNYLIYRNENFIYRYDFETEENIPLLKNDGTPLNIKDTHTDILVDSEAKVVFFGYKELNTSYLKMYDIETLTEKDQYSKFTGNTERLYFSRNKLIGNDSFSNPALGFNTEEGHYSIITDVGSIVHATDECIVTDKKIYLHRPDSSLKYFLDIDWRYTDIYKLLVTDTGSVLINKVGTLYILPNV